ncbi:MAG: hypothetical protein V2G42_05030 [bacterium JZ-2024 1]
MLARGRVRDAVRALSRSDLPRDVVDRVARAAISSGDILLAKQACTYGVSEEVLVEFVGLCMEKKELGLAGDLIISRTPSEELREQLIAASIEEGAVDLARRAARLRPTRELEPAEISRLVESALSKHNTAEAIKAVRGGAKPKDYDRIVDALLQEGNLRLAVQIAERGASRDAVDRVIGRLVDAGEGELAVQLAKTRKDERHGNLTRDERDRLVEVLLARTKSPGDLWRVLRYAREGVSGKIREPLVGALLENFDPIRLTPDTLLKENIPVNWYEAFFELVRMGVSPELSDRAMPLYLRYGGIDEAFRIAAKRRPDGRGTLTPDELAQLRRAFLEGYRTYLPDDLLRPENYDAALSRVIAIELENPFPVPENIVKAAKLRTPTGEPRLETGEAERLAQRALSDEREGVWRLPAIREMVPRQIWERAARHALHSGSFESACRVVHLAGDPTLVDWLVSVAVQGGRLEDAKRAAALRNEDGTGRLFKEEVDLLVTHFQREGMFKEAIEAVALGATQPVIDRLVSRLIDRADFRDAVEVARHGASKGVLDLLVMMCARRALWTEMMEAARIRSGGEPVVSDGEVTTLVQSAVRASDISLAIRAAALRKGSGGKLLTGEVDTLVRHLADGMKFREAIEAARLGCSRETVDWLVSRCVARGSALAREAARLRNPDGTGTLTPDEEAQLLGARPA